MNDTVLVTGGTGFVAQWCIVDLLDAGFDVRTTVRRPTAIDEVRAAVGGRARHDAARLTFATADLTADEGWDAAVDGCRFVLHVASPLGAPDPADADSLIVPARDGATRVVRAALDAGVERIVVTSAANASSPASYTDDGVSDETLWTDPDEPDLPPYRRSKTLAELAAWDLVWERSAHDRLTTVLPGAVFGPILSTANLGSVQVIGRMLRGEMPGVPRIALEVVDVRDVATAHRLAMITPGAGGERFLATGELLWMGDVARILRDHLGDAAAKVPTEEIPDDVIRQFAEVSPELRGIVPGLGRRHRHSVVKAEQLLGWTRRPAAEAVLACGTSLVEHGAV